LSSLSSSLQVVLRCRRWGWGRGGVLLLLLLLVLLLRLLLRGTGMGNALLLLLLLLLNCTGEPHRCSWRAWQDGHSYPPGGGGDGAKNKPPEPA
jgi:hypothetical protein